MKKRDIARLKSYGEDCIIRRMLKKEREKRDEKIYPAAEQYGEKGREKRQKKREI